MDFSWISHGFLIDFSWIFHGFFMDSLNNFFMDLLMDFSWISHGITLQADFFGWSFERGQMFF
jgi:hypothetical protein